MLQVDMKPFASDALEDAMRLAQTKALNSYTFSDCLSYLNYAWSDIYKRIACIDEGYYGVNVRLKEKLTKLPKFVANTVQVYSAQSPVGYDRVVYRSAGTGDLTASGVYRISGDELWCPDAERRTVWLYYVPACPQIFFTHHNRDPKVVEAGYIDTGSGTKVDETYEELLARITKRSADYGLYRLVGKSAGEEVDITDLTVDLSTIDTWLLVHKVTGDEDDITDKLLPEHDEEDEGRWVLTFVSCDRPYIFCSYSNLDTSEHTSYIYDTKLEPVRYNPFDFTGRGSDIEYVSCRYNDKTGVGAVIKDWSDLDSDGNPVIKELGWTPDTVLDYPAPEMYRYLVARLADKFSALNESSVMGVQKELAEARYAFEAFIDRNKGGFVRINNANPATIGDWL